jgi:hypothetical protein
MDAFHAIDDRGTQPLFPVIALPAPVLIDHDMRYMIEKMRSISDR